MTWPKGRPTQVHEHRFDQLSVTLVGGTVRVTRLGETPVVNQSTLGSVTLTRKGTVHTEEGLSDIPQRKIMVELKPSAGPPLSTGVPELAPREGTVKVMENDRVIVWDYSWKPGRRLSRGGDYRDSVVVFLDGGTIRIIDRGGTTDTVRRTGGVVYASGGGDAHTEEAVRGSPHAIIVEMN